MNPFADRPRLDRRWDRDMIQIVLLWLALIALLVASVVVLLFVDPDPDDCFRHWRYTTHGSAMCKDRP